MVAIRCNAGWLLARPWPPFGALWTAHPRGPPGNRLVLRLPEAEAELLAAELRAEHWANVRVLPPP